MDDDAWWVREWTALSGDDVHAILRLRAEVFVVEQRCAYLDVDGHDPGAVHVGCAWPPRAYARILPPDAVGAPARLGRVLVAAGARGTGLGRVLVGRAVEHCQVRFPGPIVLDAQAHLTALYAAFGFVPVGAIYDLDGIPHQAMRRPG